MRQSDDEQEAPHSGLSVAPLKGGTETTSGVPHDLLGEWTTRPGWSAIDERFQQAGWTREQMRQWFTTPNPDVNGRTPAQVYNQDPAHLWTLVTQTTLLPPKRN